MTPVSDKELSQRLAAIEHGPWGHGIAKMQKQLAPIEPVTLGSALDKIQLSKPNKKRAKQLGTLLRPHFLDDDGITDPREIEIRDSLDEALIMPQLFELAVETGYLPIEIIMGPARKILADVLWSKAARDFVAAYDYVAIPMLAARLGITGLGAAHPPTPTPKAAVRFAGFLAHVRDFYVDERIQIWTSFLDDYIEEPEEQDKLWSYLKGKKKKGPARAATLLAGCQDFVRSMASAFYHLDDDERGRFGLIHAYWLQKFFGYEMDATGYIKNSELWDPGDSWAHTVAKSPHLIPAGIGTEIAEVWGGQFDEDVKLLKRVFNAVRSLAASARKRH
jgi:hypothetical protein